MKISVAAVSIATTPMDWGRNLALIRAGITAAQSTNSQLVVFPELCITGYGCEDRFISQDLQQRALNTLGQLLPETAGLVVAVGLPIRHKGHLFNCVALLVDGAIAGIVAKQHLPNDGVHYEQRYFQEWPKGSQDSLLLEELGLTVPFGDLIFNVGGVILGFEICEDAWVSERPGAQLSRRGAEIILNPSASHFAFRKHEIRKRFVIEGSRAFACGYIYTNLLGCEAGRIIYDGGSLVAEVGEQVAEGSRLRLQDLEVTTARLDLEKIRIVRQRNVSSLVQNFPESPIKLPFAWRDSTEQPVQATDHSWPVNDHTEFSYAVTRGLYDYLRKTRASGCVVSLSGGADSGATAILISQLASRLISELQPEQLKKELPLIAAGLANPSVKDLTRALCHCIYTRTKNSSLETEKAATALAQELGVEFNVGSVDQLITDSVAVVNPWLGRELPWNEQSWGADDLTLQNVQARARAVIAWLIANTRGALLLTTSNRSEAAVGYCTMDGDTAGGLNLIGGVAKSFIWSWLKWCLNPDDPQFAKVQSVTKILAQQAKAELRPPGANQTDESDLGPYEVRDLLETHAIQYWRSPKSSLLELHSHFGERYSIADLGRYTELFYRLWSRNQWKRERFSPFFHLDDRSLDPRTWCRYPILSGGFEAELQEMWEWVRSQA